jgi:hypothetical protein
MKRILFLILLLTLVMAPALLPAATFWEGVQQPVTSFLSVVLMALGVPLIMKLGRKWGITIDEQLASDAINALINIIVNIDIGNANQAAPANAVTKKKLAVTIANNSLTNAQRDVLIKKYGTLEAAVQVAFERSSLNKAGK